MDELGVQGWVLAGVAAGCIGLSKGGIGGFGAVALALAADVFPARESTGIVLPLLIAGDVVAVRMFRRHAEGGTVLRLLPPTAAGVVAGYFLMDRIPAEQFGRWIGWMILGLLALQGGVAWLDRRWPGWSQGRAFAMGAGWLAGVTTMLANAAGPVAALYLLARRTPKMAFVGTSAWFFFAVNLMKIPFSAGLGLITPSSLRVDGVLVPVVVAGVFAGRWLLGKVSQRLFNILLTASAALAALRLVAG